MTKTAVAFTMTARGLWLPGVRVYFWTFTFSELHDDWVCMSQFSRFLKHLRNCFPGSWGGVRVAELHKHRGVHFHVLLNCRLPVDVVRRIGGCHGIGRVHVKRCYGEHAVTYCAKYLRKQRAGPLCESGRRARRWASFGDIAHTRVCDLVNESPVWQFRRRENLPWLGYRLEVPLGNCWLHGEACFRSAWYAGRQGNEGDLWALSQGKLEARGGGELVWRGELSVQPF